mgnify:CR=1 FL=1
MNSEDLYKILNIDKKASSDDIKKSFRRLSLLNHPDKNANDHIKAENFKQINKAYEILSNPVKRKQYDNEKNFPINFGEMAEMAGMADIADFMGFGSIPRQGVTQVHRYPDGHTVHISSGPRFSDSRNSKNSQNSQLHDELLNMLFGEEQLFNTDKVQREKKIEKPAAIIINLEIQIKDAYTGSSLPLEIERWIVENNTCRSEKENIYIEIPKGIDNNEVITLEGMGNIAERNTKGDVKIFIKINNNTNFERNGLNLIYKKTLSLKEILCGYEFDMKYIDGRIFKIRNEEVNSVLLIHFKKVIPNLGMERAGNKGDLVLEFAINNLEQLSSEQIGKLKEIL